ncbi:Protein YidD [Actinomycetales bacterium JB111]|nr:Protein YidD [Actinomycetales bacterium JB111]
MTMTDDVPRVHTHSHDDVPSDGEATDEGRRRFRPFTWLLLGMVRAYQAVVSPWLPRTCRYYPSCSAFAVGALRRHGAFKGTALAIWRVLRCNPWSRGGVDHVPERGKWVGRREPLPDPPDPGDQTHP